MNLKRYLLDGTMLAIVIALGYWDPAAQSQAPQGTPHSTWPGPKYRFDPGWPKPLPSVKDAQGATRKQVSGGVGTHCIDSSDHVIQFNRRYVEIANARITDDAVPGAPVVEFDPEGNVVNSWGEPKLTPQGMSSVLPHNTHGCSVDSQDNIWVAGNAPVRVNSTQQVVDTRTAWC